MDAKCGPGPNKTKCCATFKNGIVKIRPGFPSNSPRVLRKHALRKTPQTCLPARVQREGPKRPGSGNSIISLYCQHFSPNSGPKKGSPREAPGGPGRDPLVPKWGSERDSVFWCSIWSIYLFFDEILNITGDQ